MKLELKRFVCLECGLTFYIPYPLIRDVQWCPYCGANRFDKLSKVVYIASGRLEEGDSDV